MAEEDSTETQLKEDFFSAVKYNDFEVVDQLLRNPGLDVNWEVDQRTALALAIENCNPVLVRRLIDAGADINKPNYCRMYYTYETPIVEATRKGSNEIFDLLLNSATPVNLASDGRKNALMWASSYSDDHMVTGLLKQEDIDVNWVGDDGNTALHSAVTHGRENIVEILLSHGAEVCYNRELRTPLHTAGVYGYERIAKALLKHRARIDAVDIYGNTPFSLACMRDHLEVAQEMKAVFDGDDDIDWHDLLGSGLHGACMLENIDVLKWLLSVGADANYTKKDGSTPLITAAVSKPSYEKLSLLIENGAQVNHVTTKGLTALQHVLEVSHDWRVHDLLVYHGADIIPQTVSKQLLLPICLACPADTLTVLLHSGALSRNSTKAYMQEWCSMYADTVTSEMNDTQASVEIKQVLKFTKLMDSVLLHPPKLINICRHTVRRLMVSITGGKSIVPLTKTISSVPAPVVEFLLLNDIRQTEPSHEH